MTLAVTIAAALMATDTGTVLYPTPRDSFPAEIEIIEYPTVILGQELKRNHDFTASHGFLSSFYTKNSSEILEGIELGVDIVHTNPRLGRSIMRRTRPRISLTTISTQTASERTQALCKDDLSQVPSKHRHRRTKKRTKRVHFDENLPGRRRSNNSDSNWSPIRPASPPPRVSSHRTSPTKVSTGPISDQCSTGTLMETLEQTRRSSTVTLIHQKTPHCSQLEEWNMTPRNHSWNIR